MRKFAFASSFMLTVYAVGVRADDAEADAVRWPPQGVGACRQHG